MRQMQFHDAQDKSPEIGKGDFESIWQPVHLLRHTAQPCGFHGQGNKDITPDIVQNEW
jgi:hypothetical protein